MREYTIREITGIVDRTEATLYSYMREDTDFFEAHRRKQTKGGYLYDEKAVERLKMRCGVSLGVVEGIFKTEDGENPQHTAPANEELEALKSKLEEITNKYEALQADFARVEGERVELMRQNGLRSEEINHLLLLISQEKAEKEKIMLMLPTPRKTIGERIRELFRKNRPSGKSI